MHTDGELCEYMAEMSRIYSLARYGSLSKQEAISQIDSYYIEHVNLLQEKNREYLHKQCFTLIRRTDHLIT